MPKIVVTELGTSVRVTDAERYRQVSRECRTDRKMQKMFIRCSSSDESRLGGDEGLRGTFKERIKRMSSAYVTDK